MRLNMIVEKYGCFFDDDNINKILWIKNKKELYTLFYINNFINKQDNIKLTLKTFYKYQICKQVKKTSLSNSN